MNAFYTQTLGKDNNGITALSNGDSLMGEMTLILGKLGELKKIKWSKKFKLIFL